MNNIVVFGPAHSGKSTLMGYIKTRHLSDQDFADQERSIRKRIIDGGGAYEDAFRFAYFVDTGKDEYIRKKESNSIGTSKRLHYRTVDFQLNDVFTKLTFIDTPGSNMTWKDRYEGIFLGDIGLYVVDVKEVIKLSQKIVGSSNYNEQKNNLFYALELWNAYKDKSRVIIVMSKCDYDDINSNDVFNCYDTIQGIPYLKDIPITIIGIDIKNRRDYNIFSDELPFELPFIEQNLSNSITAYLNTDLEKTYSNPLFAYIERTFHTHDTNEFTYRMKVLRGHCKIKQKIKIIPARENSQSKSFSEVVGIVKSLMKEDDQKVDEMHEGDIGGVLLQKLTHERRQINANDVDITKTSVIIDESTKYASGNLLYFSIAKDLFDEYSSKKLTTFRINSKVNLIWFGKIISGSLIGLHRFRDDWRLTVYIPHTPVILPVKDNGDVFFSIFSIEIVNRLFFQVNLLHIDTLTQEYKEMIFEFSCDHTFEIQKYGLTINHFDNENNIHKCSFLLNEANVRDQLNKIRDILFDECNENPIREYALYFKDIPS